MRFGQSLINAILTACSAVALMPTAAHSQTTFTFQNGVQVALTTSAGAEQVAVSPATAAAPFQGVGANLVGLSDLNYVACSTAGGRSCNAQPPNPSVPATSVRAAINLPFTSTPTYYKNAGGACVAVDLTAMGVDSTSPASTLAFYATYGATPIYASNACTGPSSSMSQAFGTSSACATKYAGACFMDALGQKNIDWVQIFFGAPFDYVVSCGAACTAINGDPRVMANLGAYKAGQLVYQGRFGLAPTAPRYIELFNEPEGGWNVKLTPAQYSQVVANFEGSLSQLIALRLSDNTISSAERSYLAALTGAQLLGPGLGSAFKFDYAGDTGAAWKTTWTSWFSGTADASTFFSALASASGALSTHAYDDKYAPNVGPQLSVLSGIQNMIRVRALLQNNSPILVTEAAASVDSDNDTLAYQSFCAAHPRQDGSPGACSPAMSGDPANDAFSYPDCVPGAFYNDTAYAASTNAAIATFCHHQASKLIRNLANLANQADQNNAAITGVSGELIWSLTPSRTSSLNGLITRSGVSSLMNATVAQWMNSFSRDGLSTVFPIASLDANSGAVLVAPRQASPSTARLVLANSADAPMTYALDFGNTPFAQFTRVVLGVASGGTSDTYTGSTLAASNLVQAPVGQTFASATSRLLVTLPMNSEVTLDLAI